MRPEKLNRFAAAGAYVLLALMAGHLLLRQVFAHLSIQSVVKFISGCEVSFLQHAYLTETAVLALLPLAVLLLRKTLRETDAGQTSLVLALCLGAWCAGHAAVALSAGRGAYLVFRQSALAGYVILFVCTCLFFRGDPRRAGRAVIWGLSAACLCAVADGAADYFRGSTPLDAASGWVRFFGERPYGQQTLALGILGFGLVIAAAKRRWKLLGLAALALLGWRQAARPQSTVAVSLAGALGLYLLTGLGLAIQGQRRTLWRAVCLLALFGVLFLGYKGVHKMNQDETQEVRAWSLNIYSGLFTAYANAAVPANPAGWVFSTRTALPVNDPEVYRLNAVFHSSSDLSVRNNMWRFLVWRRMFLDWRDGSRWAGAGPGQRWFYGSHTPRESALYHTAFHYGEDDLGLDPHNSYINFLYRFGVLGLALLAALAGSVLALAWRALRAAPAGGDVRLEGVLLFFFYSAVFACFQVALEGPSYALPFWMSLGLVWVESSRRLLPASEAVLKSKA